jgi:hypothetical protein
MLRSAQHDRLVPTFKASVGRGGRGCQGKHLIAARGADPSGIITST